MFCLAEPSATSIARLHNKCGLEPSQIVDDHLHFIGQGDNLDCILSLFRKVKLTSLPRGQSCNQIILARFNQEQKHVVISLYCVGSEALSETCVRLNLSVKPCCFSTRIRPKAPIIPMCLANNGRSAAVHGFSCFLFHIQQT